MLFDHLHGLCGLLGIYLTSVLLHKGVEEIDERRKVKVLIDGHFFLRAVGNEVIGQVQDGSTMTAIKDTRHRHTARHGTNEGLKNIVITNLSC